ncbi:acyl-CoA N-acyltransferase [Collybia nuda]|uniref:Acyl-CoA N-acyltransferase n=1 Tax=Collybia nuda TaxID=64659 RepID=A0A9P5YFZ8_9AGAR|nr:acyl-CoA N-acyltransferase [Collybia nuda]
MFSTERLRLRAYTESDLPILLAIVNNTQVQSTLISEHVVPRSARFAIKLEEIANEALLYVVLEVADRDGEVIGAASITVESPKNRDVALGIGILPGAWNKGYGTEATRFLVDYAFRSLGVHRVSLNVIESNIGAVALYKKIGFIEEGRRRKSIWLNGTWQDSIYMGLLEEEWLRRECLKTW